MHQGPTVCSGRQAAAARRDGTSSFRGGISGCVVFRAAGCTEFSLRSQLGHIWFFFLSWFLCIFFYLNLLLINVLFYIVNTWMTLNDWFECVTPSLTALHLCTHYTPQSTLHCSLFPLMGILCCFAVLRESGRTDLGRYLFQVTHPVCFKHLHDHTLVLCVCVRQTLLV